MRMYGRRRREISAEETAANAQARASRFAAGMHCQCCGKLFLANTGVMAHHGYQRPGGGWQTASCSGARFVPFEVSRAQLGSLIESLKAWKARAIEARAATEAETLMVVLSFSDYSQKIGYGGRMPSKTVMVSRENFEAIKAENEQSFRMTGRYNFDEVKAKDLWKRDREIENVTAEISAQQKRYEGWVQTHEWKNKAWAALAQ